MWYGYSVDEQVETNLDRDKAKTQKLILNLIHDLDHLFWDALEDFNLILGLNYEEQIQSERKKSHLGLVMTRWKKIESHLWDLS